MLRKLIISLLLFWLTSCQDGGEARNVRGAAQSGGLASVEPLEFVAGQKITLTGTNFYKGMTIKFGDVEINPQIIDRENAVFIAPRQFSAEVELVRGEDSFVLKALDYIYPRYFGDSENICESQKYIDAQGKVVDGKKKCGGSAEECAEDGQQDCIATQEFRAADGARLQASNIKSGEIIAGVVGEYPSANYPLGNAEATDNLTSTNFEAKLRSTSTFEFFDQAGNRYEMSGEPNLRTDFIPVGTALFGLTGTGTLEAHVACSTDGEIGCITTTGFKSADMSVSIATNIKDGATIAGIAGSVIEETHVNCSTDGEIGCVALTTFKAADMNQVVAGNIKDGSTIGSIAGDYPSAANPLPNASILIDDLDNATFAAKMKSATQFEYYDATGARYLGNGDGDLTAANIGDGIDIFGEAGSSTFESHADCSADGETSCVTVAGFKAADMANVTAGNIKDGVVIGEVTGDFPSIAHPLNGADGTADLTETGFAAKIKSATLFEYFDSQGTRYAGAGDVDLVASNVADGVEISDVSGTAELESHSDCVADAEVGCVAVASFMAADMSNVTAGNIKDGVTVGGVTGDFPSATYPLFGADGTADLTSATLETKMRASTAFEYFDSAGIRQSGVGDADLAASNIADDAVIFGVTGTAILETHSDCAVDAEIGCVAVAAFRAADMDDVDAGNIKAGVTIGGVGGDYPSASYLLTGADGTADLTAATFATKIKSATAFEYFDSFGVRHTGAGDTDLTATQVADSVQIFDVTGSREIESHSDCSADAEIGCVTFAAFKAADMANVTAGNLKANVMIGGETGDYPSATYPLVDASAVINDLDNATFEAKMKSGTQFEFFDSAGARYLNSGDATIAAGNIVDGVQIFDITGTADLETHSDCSADSQTGCVAVETFKAADMSNVTAANIKDGVVVAGVTGDYPSASNTLPGASAVADLNSATFTAKVKSTTAFEYWDSSGTRYTGAGDDDIVDSKIKNGTDIFSITGTYDGETPDAWDIRAGVAINGVTGSLKMNCRNPIVSARYNYDGSTTNIPSTGIATGTVLNWWDTVTDYNSGVSFPGPAIPNDGSPENTWSASNYCDEENFEVIVTDGACDTAGDECMIRDKIANMVFSEISSGGIDWNDAVAHCDVLEHGGYDDWRLPTQKELIQAYVHGIRAINDLGLQFVSFDNIFWSATTAEWRVPFGGHDAYYMNLADGQTTILTKTDTTPRAMCIREP
jgi:hypothetical protein